MINLHHLANILNSLYLTFSIFNSILEWNRKIYLKLCFSRNPAKAGIFFGQTFLVAHGVQYKQACLASCDRLISF